MSKQKFYKVLIVGYSFLPLVAVAQTTLDSLLPRVQNTLTSIIGILFIIATIIFIWGVIQFIVKAGDEAGRAKAKGIMTWGIIGLAVMVAAWGVVTLLVNYFSVGGKGIPGRPGEL